MPVPKRVSVFVTCLVDQIFPDAGLAMAKVLESIGCAVDFPEDQTCCGQPAFNSGYRAEALQVARHFLSVFEKSDYIVVPSGSCASMISHHYAQCTGDPGLLREFHHLEPKVWEFSKFLVDLCGIDDVGATFHETVTYHDSCHALRELKIKDSPRRLLANVRGLTLTEMTPHEECCGFGGTFSVKFAELSSRMALTKVQAIQNTGANIVVSIDSSCLMQIEGTLRRAGSPVRTMHLASVLAQGI
ncbi:MAG: (Fe-S)-binding protein [Acidobacteria bacterium]|nr:(Fe-S)-binding protein [Acidobacteriota bacterium]